MEEVEPDPGQLVGDSSGWRWIREGHHPTHPLTHGWDRGHMPRHGNGDHGMLGWLIWSMAHEHSR